MYQLDGKFTVSILMRFTHIMTASHCNIFASKWDSEMENTFLTAWTLSLSLMILKIFNIHIMVETACCKKQLKKVPDHLLTGLENREPLKILNGIKLILDDQGNHLDSYNQFGIIQVLQRSPILNNFWIISKCQMFFVFLIWFLSFKSFRVPYPANQ